MNTINISSNLFSPPQPCHFVTFQNCIFQKPAWFPNENKAVTKESPIVFLWDMMADMCKRAETKAEKREKDLNNQFQ